ncbi:MAG: hypothetical protein J1E57_10450 [Prevotella sp.]|nr:hypothetical protein [Prevotella sp.]
MKKLQCVPWHKRCDTSVGNIQMQNEAFMADALRHSMKAGFTTIRNFMSLSGLIYLCLFPFYPLFVFLFGLMESIYLL